MKNLFFFLLFFLALNSAQAGTYNFYFNNTEQGANSKASPSVTINSPNAASNNPAPAPANPALPAPGAAAPAEIPAVSQGTLFEPTVKRAYPLIRIFGGAAATNSQSSPIVKDPSTSWFYSSTSYNSAAGRIVKKTSRQYLASLSFFIMKDFAVSFLAGRLLGPELEFYFLNQGRRGFQTAILGGVFKDKLKKIPGRTGLFDVGQNEPKKFQAHAGIHLAYNFAEKFGLMAAYRIGLGNQTNYRTSTLSGGAAVYF